MVLMLVYDKCQYFDECVVDQERDQIKEGIYGEVDVDLWMVGVLGLYQVFKYFWGVDQYVEYLCVGLVVD